jgi:hypothetical protein
MFTNKNIFAMKKIALILTLSLPMSWLGAQSYGMPDAELRNIDGYIVSSAQVVKAGNATLLVFWNAANRECCENIDLMNEAWIESLRQQGIKMVAISARCNGSWTQVKPVVHGNGWEFETYIDVNGDFVRAMCVGEMPCAMLFGEDQKLLCRYNSACTGDQDFICGNILEHLYKEEATVELSSEFH